MEMISSNKLYAPLIDNKDGGDKKNEVTLSIMFFILPLYFQLITWIKNYSNHQAVEEATSIPKKEVRRQSIKFSHPPEQRLKSTINFQTDV